MLATLENTTAPIADAPKGRKTKGTHDKQACVDFGHRLARAVQDNNMTQADFARAVDVTRSAVNWWFNGDTYPSIDKVKEIANLLRVSKGWLLFGEHSVDSTSANVNIPIEGVDNTFVTLPLHFVAHMTGNPAGLKAIGIKGSNGRSMAIVNIGDVAISDEPRMMAIKDPYGDGASVVRVFKSPNKTDAIVMQSEQKSTEVLYRPAMFIGSLTAMVEGRLN